MSWEDFKIALIGGIIGGVVGKIIVEVIAWLFL